MFKTMFEILEDMRPLFRAFLDVRRLFLPMLAVSVLSAMSAPVTNLAIAKIVDADFSDSGFFQYAAMWLSVAFALMLTNSIMITISNTYSTQVSAQVFANNLGNLSARTLANIRDPKKMSEIQTAIAAGRSSIDGILFVLIHIIFGVFTQVAFSFILLGINFGWVLAFAMLAFALVPFLVGLAQTQYMVRLQKDYQDVLFNFNGEAREMVAHHRLMAIYNTPRYEQNRLESSLTKLLAALKAVQFKEVKTQSVVDGIRMLGLFLVMLFILYQTSKGVISLGGFVFINAYMGMFILFLANFGVQVTRLNKSWIAIRPLFEHDEAAVMPAPQSPLAIEKLRVKNWRADYLPALNADAVYEFERGKIYLIDGHNGAGKSTLMQAMLGLGQDNHCDVEVLTDGEWVEIPENARVMHFSYATQDEENWARDVTENMAYAGKADHGENGDNAGGAALLPERIPSDKNTVQLSGGQRQLVHVLRALGKDCDVIVLDEPTNNLDGKIAKSLALYLQEYARDKIVLMATHDPYFKEISDVNVALV